MAGVKEMQVLLKTIWIVAISTRKLQHCHGKKVMIFLKMLFVLKSHITTSG